MTRMRRHRGLVLATVAMLAIVAGPSMASLDVAGATVLEAGALDGATIADSTATKDSRTFTSPHASGIAWLNMKGFDADKAATKDGQRMSVQVGRFHLGFVVRYADSVSGVTRQNLQAVSTTWEHSAFANIYYSGAQMTDDSDFAPILYQTVAEQDANGNRKNSGGRLTLDDIAVTATEDSGIEEKITAYSMVIADAEATSATVNAATGQVNAEQWTVSSDRDISSTQLLPGYSTRTTGATMQYMDMPACSGAGTGLSADG